MTITVFEAEGTIKACHSGVLQHKESRIWSFTQEGSSLFQHGSQGHLGIDLPDMALAELLPHHPGASNGVGQREAALPAGAEHHFLLHIQKLHQPFTCACHPCWGQENPTQGRMVPAGDTQTVVPEQNPHL